MLKLSANPTSDLMRGREVELGSLDLGSYFHVYGTNGKRIVSGYLMDQTVSCCYVLPTSETDENIQGREGELRRVIKLGETVDWASSSPVEFVEIDPEVRAGILESKRERSQRYERKPAVDRRIQMSLQLSDDPKLRAIQVRWSFQVKQLSIGLQTGNLPKTTTARQTLKAIVEQAVSQGVMSLPPIPEYVEDDPVFEELQKYIVARPNQAPSKQLGTGGVGKQRGGSQEGMYKRVTALSSLPHNQLVDGDEEDEGETVMALSAKKGAGATALVEDEAEEVVADETTEEVAVAPVAAGPSKAEKLKAQQAAAKAGAKAKGAAVAATPKAKKPTVLGPCLDGCGANVAAKFAPGHDAKLKSLILKIERGDEPMSAVAEMPAAAYLKFKKGPIMPSEDGKTKVQTYLCTQSPVRLIGRDEVKFVEVTRE